VNRVADDAQELSAAFGEGSVVCYHRVDAVARGRVGAGQALPDAGFWLAAAGAQSLCAQFLGHGHVDDDEPPVAPVEFVDHAAGDVGDDDEPVAYVGVDQCRESVAEPVRAPEHGEGAAVACRREVILGHRVVLLAGTGRPGDGTAGEAGERAGAFAGVRQQGVFPHPAGPDDGDERAGADRLGHETRVPCRYTPRTTGTRSPRG
jgi:hypothetical protein